MKPVNVCDAVDFERAIIALLPWLTKRARAMTRDHDDSNDLVQDTIERALKYRKPFQQTAELRAWIHRILRNLFIDRLRRLREVRIDARDLENMPGPESEPPAAWCDLSLEDVHVALGQVASPLRAVLDVHLRGALSYRALARQFDLPPSTVATRIHRGRKQLRLALLAQRPTNDAARDRDAG